MRITVAPATRLPGQAHAWRLGGWRRFGWARYVGWRRVSYASPLAPEQALAALLAGLAEPRTYVHGTVTGQRVRLCVRKHLRSGLRPAFAGRLVRDDRGSRLVGRLRANPAMQLFWLGWVVLILSVITLDSGRRSPLPLVLLPVLLVLIAGPAAYQSRAEGDELQLWLAARLRSAGGSVLGGSVLDEGEDAGGAAGAADDGQRAGDDEGAAGG